MKELLQQVEFLPIIIFTVLCFLGVAVRISYDVEVKGIRYGIKNFFNRFLITLFLCYIIEVFIIKIKDWKSYYSAIILFFAFFSIDIIKFITTNIQIVIIYSLNIFLKTFTDLIQGLNKTRNNKPNNKE